MMSIKLYFVAASSQSLPNCDKQIRIDILLWPDILAHQVHV